MQDITRRAFVKSSAALAAAYAAEGSAQQSRILNGKRLAYVGTYTGEAENRGNGEGIYLVEMDAQTGRLSQPRLVAQTPSPSWLDFDPRRGHLYALNEISDYQGRNGSLSAFAIDAGSGMLHAINTVSSASAQPAYLSLDATRDFVFVANYGGGGIAVLPVQGDGSLGRAIDVHQDSDSVGAQHATSAPRGSFAISGHDKPHAHMIAADPHNRFVLATDLGQDRIYVYRFDAARGKLRPSAGTPHVALPSGDGPRHFVFHPNGRWLYSLQEEASSIAFFHYDGERGALAHIETISSLPAGFAGSNFASEIAVSKDGRFLYAANRLHDTITVCAISPDGRIRYAGEASTMGDYPRSFRMDPSGRFLYVCNQKSDCLTSFRVNRETGLLTFTGEYTPVGSPACMLFFS